MLALELSQRVLGNIHTLYTSKAGVLLNGLRGSMFMLMAVVREV